MVNYPHNNLFNRGDTDRQLRIDFTGGTITNKEMHQGSFSLTESLCSEESLRFGSCESSALAFKVHNVLTPLAGQELTVYEVLNGNTAEPFHYGKYKVQSDKPTADRRYRDVVAYDAMYDILNADVASWYNSLTFPCSIGYFRKKFLSYLKVECVDAELVNDGIYIQKTVEVEQLSGKQVINAICEINGCFGHINRQGKFEFVVLKQFSPGLYPSETLYPSEELYPRKSNSAELFPSSKYSACKYEDFKTKLITGVQIRQEEDDIGATVGTTANVYVVEENFIVYGKTHDELTEIANNLLSVIDNIYYRPIEYVKTNGKPYLEVGDNISVGSSEVIIETYILKRTITAVKGQKDEFSAKGVETYPKELYGLNKQITQLKSKTNKLTRTVEETKSEIKDVEKSIRTEITQTEEDIRLEVVQTKEYGERQLEIAKSEISLDIDTVKLSVEDLRSDTEADLKINSDAIAAEVARSKEAESSLSIRADSISLSVENLETEVDSRISILSNEINLKVSSGEVQSMIDISLDEIVITASQIRLEGYFTANNGFSVDDSGNVTLSGGGASVYVSSSGLVVSDSSATAGYFGASEALTKNMLCTTLNGHTPITSNNISSYVTDYGFEIQQIQSDIEALRKEDETIEKLAMSNLEAITSLTDRVAALEKLLSGGSWSYMQLQGYDGDEYAYSYFTK